MKSRALAVIALVGLLGVLLPGGAAARTASAGHVAAVRAGAVRVSSTELVAPRSVAPVATAGDGDVHIETTFTGLNFDDGGGSVPPDVQIGVGPNAIVEMVNTAGRIWTKAGVVTKTFDLATLFHTGSDDISDPRVLYDAATDRWFASLLNVRRSRVELAVSTGSDPAGTWTNYSIPPTAGACPDQPKLALGNQALVVTADFFDTSCNSSEQGNAASKFWVVDKAALVAGSPLKLRAFGPSSDYSGIMPVQDVTASDTVYIAAVNWDNQPDQLHVYTITGAPTDTMTVPTQDIAIKPLKPHAHGNQPGPIDLEAQAGKIDDGAFQDGVISLVADDECTPSGDTAKRACARILQVSTSSWNLVNQVELNMAGQDLSYPALRPDAGGNLDIVFGYSSNTTFPSLAVRTLAADGTFSASTPVLGVGTTSVSDAGDATAKDLARYGDYFGAAVDPSDPNLVWLAGEIGKKTPNGDWSTVIGSARFAAGPPLSVSASAAAIPWGTGVTLSVHLGPAEGGASGAARGVHLQASRDHTTWATISELTTDGSGRATFNYRPATNLYYRAVFDGTADYPAITSAEKRVTVRQILVFRPDNAGQIQVVNAGDAVTFTATVRPARSDVPPGRVTLQLWEHDGSWRLVSSKTVTPDASGHATFRITFTDQASYYVRAIANPTSLNANSAWSASQRYDAV